MVLSHRAKFQLIINFFRVSMYLSYFYRTIKGSNLGLDKSNVVLPTADIATTFLQTELAVFPADAMQSG